MTRTPSTETGPVGATGNDASQADDSTVAASASATAEPLPSSLIIVMVRTKGGSARTHCRQDDVFQNGSSDGVSRRSSPRVAGEVGPHRCSNVATKRRTVPLASKIASVISKRPNTWLQPDPSPLMSRPGDAPCRNGALVAFSYTPGRSGRPSGAPNARLHRDEPRLTVTARSLP